MKESTKTKKKKTGKAARTWDALALTGGEDIPDDDAVLFDAFEDELLDAGQQEYTLYGEQLSMTERHLETLIEDTNSALKLLTSLSESFRGVEEQTSTFQSQCEDLLSEQRRLEKLADEVGTDLHYYAYIDNVTRRLNAPGAGRQVEDESFGETMQNLDACIAFMEKNVSPAPTWQTGTLTLTRNSPRTEMPSPIWHATSPCSQKHYTCSRSGCRAAWTGCLATLLGRSRRRSPNRHGTRSPTVVSRR